jgi:hypothetical protein
LLKVIPQANHHPSSATLVPVHFERLNKLRAVERATTLKAKALSQILIRV